MKFILVGILLLIGALYVISVPQPPVKDNRTLPADSSQGRAAIGGAFTALDHRGEPFTQDNLLGQYHLMYFGFTYCPDICPASLLVMANTMDDLPPDITDQLRLVFVTVDPSRDTVEVIRQYVENFHEKLIGVTGSEEQIQQLAKAYKVYYSKAENDPVTGEYLVDHSSYMYLMDPKGRYVTHFPHNVSMQVLADGLRRHIPHR
jgi:Uncharacterized protein SCO1/SenC/PrrC, involved in biogenesis of respiratory and photosynthetic systems